MGEALGDGGAAGGEGDGVAVGVCICSYGGYAREELDDSSFGALVAELADDFWDGPVGCRAGASRDALESAGAFAEERAVCGDCTFFAS